MEGQFAGMIPLRARDGSLKAWAIVDAEDMERVGGHRWYLRPNGYVARQVTVGKKKQRTVLLHREIMGLEHGDPRMVDHRDHDPLNNTRENLRICTHAENHQNRRACGDRGTSSRFRGVSFQVPRRPRPWHAYGTLNGKQVNIGFFATEEEAAEAARAWRREHMPFATD